MKSKVIALITLIAAAGASVGAYAVIKDKKNTENEKAKEVYNDLQLLNFDPDTIDEISINSGGKTYTAKYADQKWSFIDVEDLTPDQDYFTLIKEYSSSLRAESQPNGELSAFGLDEGNFETITLKGGGKTYSFNIGDVSPTKEYYYVTVEGKSGVYAVPSIYGEAFNADKLMLRSKNLVLYGDNDMAEITIKKNDKVICGLVYNDDTSFWEFKEKTNLPFDNTAVTAMINVITRLQAEKLIEYKDEDADTYGFDDPYGEVDIKGKDGTEKKITFGDAFSDDVFRYVKIEGDNHVHVYYNSDVDFVDNTMVDFISTTVQKPRTSDINGIKFTLEGKEHEMKIDTEGKKCSCDGKAFDLNDETIASAFTNFYSALSTRIIASVDIEAKPELKDPILTVVYDLKDGKKYTYQLVSKDEKSCYVFNDGKYDGEIISSEGFIGKNSVKTFFDKLVTAIN